MVAIARAAVQRGDLGLANRLVKELGMGGLAPAQLWLLTTAYHRVGKERGRQEQGGSGDYHHLLTDMHFVKQVMRAGGWEVKGKTPTGIGCVMAAGGLLQLSHLPGFVEEVGEALMCKGL